MAPRYFAHIPEGPRSTGRVCEPRRPCTSGSTRCWPSLSKVLSPSRWVPAAVRRWRQPPWKASTVADGAARTSRRRTDWEDSGALATMEALKEMGWSTARTPARVSADVQPRHYSRFRLSGRSETDLLAGFNQLWRRNIQKAQKAGVVGEGVAGSPGVLSRVPSSTAGCDGFIPDRSPTAPGTHVGRHDRRRSRPDHRLSGLPRRQVLAARWLGRETTRCSAGASSNEGGTSGRATQPVADDHRLTPRPGRP